MHIYQGLLEGHVLPRTPRGAQVVVTGRCARAGLVTVTIRKGGRALKGKKDMAVGRAAHGRFKAVVKGIPTGGPYTFELSCGKQHVEVKEIFVGDLWLMAGQSNMAGVGNMIDAPTPHPMVRNFSMARRWELARDPLHLLAESPDRVHAVSPVSVGEAASAKRKAIKGVGVGVYFGKLMFAKTGVPQGLIATAQGGSSMAKWSPALKTKGGGSLYGSMLRSVQAVGQPLAGVLWYQGCAETNLTCPHG